MLFLGSVLGRIKFSAWCLLVPLWSTCVYAVDAFLLWGGGYFAQEGALDFSGGFVIHMSAGVSGFVAAWVLGPRLMRDRQHAIPNNLVMAAVGAGILWLGWNGFNGGDPYYAGADAAAAVVNTNASRRRSGSSMWTGHGCVRFSKSKKPTFLGGVNGMICGLVGITPSAGWVNGWGAILVGSIATFLVWIAWNYLSKGQAVLEGGRRPRCHLHPRHRRLLRWSAWSGLFADPGMIQQGCTGTLDANGQVTSTPHRIACTHLRSTEAAHRSVCRRPHVHRVQPHQLWEQFREAAPSG